MFGTSWYGDFTPSSACVALMQAPADDGEPKKFHPLDSFTPEDLYPLDTIVPEDFMATQPNKFYPLDCFMPDHYYPLDSFAFIAIQKDLIALALAITVPSSMLGSLACSHPMPVLTLAGTINGKTPCPSAPSSVIKSYYRDADGESKDYAINAHGDKLTNHPDDAHSYLLVSHLSAVPTSFLGPLVW